MRLTSSPHLIIIRATMALKLPNELWVSILEAIIPICQCFESILSLSTTCRGLRALYGVHQPPIRNPHRSRRPRIPQRNLQSLLLYLPNKPNRLQSVSSPRDCSTALSTNPNPLPAPLSNLTSSLNNTAPAPLYMFWCFSLIPVACIVLEVLSELNSRYHCFVLW